MVSYRWSAVLLMMGLASGHQAALAQSAEEPRRYCARAGVDDTLRPLPASLVGAATRLFGLRAPASYVQRTTVFRCAGGRVEVCNLGANLPCGKANTSRALPGAIQYCREHPGSDFIPMYVTGHDTIYRWRCADAAGGCRRAGGAG